MRYIGHSEPRPPGASPGELGVHAMTWTLDPHHTSVAFSAKHMGVATVRGRFDQVTADLDLDDPNDPTTGRGTITMQAASINTGSEMRDGHLKGADFLDVEKYPTIIFTLKSMKEDGSDNFKVDRRSDDQGRHQGDRARLRAQRHRNRSVRQPQGRRHADRNHQPHRLGSRLERPAWRWRSAGRREGQARDRR